MRKVPLDMWSALSRFLLRCGVFLVRKPGHFNSIPARRPLPAVTVRRYKPTDFDACEEIFILNEPGRFPQNGLPAFTEFLQNPTHFIIVAEDAGKVLGCGGLSYSDGYLEGGTAFLVFGLVHPEHHRRGIGTVMLLVRLAQLRLRTNTCPVLIFSVPASFKYFVRFGFTYAGYWLTENAIKYPIGLLFMTSQSIRLCGLILTKAGISYPYEPDAVPLWKGPEPVKLAE